MITLFPLLTLTATVRIGWSCPVLSWYLYHINRAVFMVYSQTVSPCLFIEYRCSEYNTMINYYIIVTCACLAYYLCTYIYRGIPIENSINQSTATDQSHHNNDSNQHKTNKRVIVITGCDYGGLGYQLVNQLLSSHYPFHIIACHYNNQCKQLIELAQQYNCADRLHTVQLDLLSDESIQYACKQITSIVHTPGIYSLINNAASNTGWLSEFTNIQTYKNVMQVNLFGLIQFTHLLLPHIKQYSGGELSRIININSFYGTISTFSQSAYAASKHALHAYTTALRQELCSFNVYVISCDMGTMDTTMIHTTQQSMTSIYTHINNQQLSEQYGTTYQLCIQRAVMLMKLLAANPCRYAHQIVHNTIIAKYPAARTVYGMDAMIMIYTYAFIPLWLYDIAVLKFIGNPKPDSVKLSVVK